MTSIVIALAIRTVLREIYLSHWSQSPGRAGPTRVQGDQSGIQRSNDHAARAGTLAFRVRLLPDAHAARGHV